VISVGVIGCGAVVHSMYARTLVGRNEYAVRYVHDSNPAQAASAAALFGAEVVGLDAMLANAEAIIVSTPPSTHAQIIGEVIAPGRTILCEKPYMATRADAARLASSARGAGARLYVGHFRRLFPQLGLARELVGLGAIGDVEEITASEGGRFTWNAVSNYTTRDASGGVLWDTGSHTLDMALFASGLDGMSDLVVRLGDVRRDKPEPSHDFHAMFTLSDGGRTISVRLRLSRKEALPNLVTIRGSRGTIAFITDLDHRVRLTTPSGTAVLSADRSFSDLLECFDLQLRRILLEDGAEMFAAERFIEQIGILEVLANA
jgi:predicted dehydrogenase